jgi:hypothetical protein
MKAKQLKAILDNIAGIAALYFAFTEVAFPWSIATALLGFAFCIFSESTWRVVMHPSTAALSHGAIGYVIQVVSRLITSAIPLFLIQLLPGGSPDKVLMIASSYAFVKAALFSTVQAKT